MAGSTVQTVLTHATPSAALGVGDIAAREASMPRDFSTLHGGRADASGLPLTMAEGRPAEPGMTAARSLQLTFKRMFDIVTSLAAIIMLSPLLIGVAIIIARTSSGKVLFKQKRDGLNGETIEVYKFRSMYEDRCDITGVAQTTRDDPRITPIGRVIRRTNIDELPQLFNILRGDMSVIGPRPHPIGMLAAGKPYEEIVPYYQSRHMMKPGLSGWAQANGLRGPTDDARTARARIEHDLAYIQNFSLWLDLKIVMTTLRNEFVQGSGS